MFRNISKPACSAFLMLVVSMTWTSAADTLSTSADLYPTPATAWTLSAKQAGFDQITPENAPDGLLASPLRMVITDGKTGRDLSGTTRRTDFTARRTARFAQALDLPDVRATHSLAAGDMLTWRVEIANDGREEVWLEIALVAPLALGDPLSYWDGADLHESLEGDAGRDEIDLTFPASAVFDADTGLTVGVRPDSLISHLASHVDDDRTLTYGTRFVIPPGESAAVEFVLFTFVPTFGHVDAIYGYQQRFPEAFDISDDVDPRITRSGTDTLGYGRAAQNVSEESEVTERVTRVRAGYGSWDWAYAPFRRCGDWLGRSEVWDWEMDETERARVESRAAKFWCDLKDPERFRADRAAGWSNIDMRFNTALVFYLISWMEEHLLEQLDGEDFMYPYGESGSRLNWVTGTSFERHVFPWGTVYEDTIRRDIPEVIAELDLHGFGLDIASDRGRFRGELSRYIPGWAWDEEGRFIHAGVGQRLLLDYVRGLRQDGFRMGVVTNGGNPFMVATASDSLLNEAKDQPNLRYDTFKQTRWFFGSKRIHLHSGGGFDNPALNVDWQNFTPDQVRLFYQDHLNEWLLGCWQGGYVPATMYVYGRESVTRAMPALIDVQGRGYRSVPACQGDARLERARYGQGLQSVLAISNPTTETVSSDEHILSPYLCEGAALPVAYDGEALEFDLDDASTRLPIDLWRKQTRLVCTPIALRAADGAPLALSGSSSGRVSADRITWTLALVAPDARTVRLQVEAPPDFALDQVRLNGARVDLAAPLSLRAGENQLVVRCTSLVFRSPERALVDFPYAGSVLAPTDPANEREAAAAQMLRDFFAFHEQTTLPDGFADVQPAIVISTEGERGISVDDGTLRIRGATPFDTQQLTARLIRLLMDRKYEFVHPFAETVPLQPTRDMLATIGVNKSSYFPQIEVAGREVPGRLVGTQLPGVEVVRAREARPEYESPMSAGFYADENVCAWAVKAPMLVDYASVSVYVNADSAGTGRASVADGTDWRLSARRGEEGLRLTRYRDIPAGADNQTITANSKSRQVAQYQGGAVRSGDVIYILIDPELLAAMAPSADHRFYVLANGPDETMARGTWSVDPDPGTVVTPILDMTPPPTPGAAPGPRPVLEIPTLQGDLTLDGHLDEDLWQQAGVFESLIPLRGARLRESTQAFAFFTEDALVLGFRCWDAQMQYVHSGRYARDADRIWMNADHVEIFLAPGVEPEATQYPFYQLMVSPSGSQWDGYGLDVGWDGEWEAAATTGENSWSAEVRIPLSELEGADSATTWRANVARYRSVVREWGTWAPLEHGLQKPLGFGVIRRP